ncbi:lipoyl(octanoyl) transferase LipB [Nitrospira sp. Nam80]
MTMPADLIIDDRIPYETALGRQNRIARERADNARTDALWLLEHEPIFTAGRTTNRAAWPSDEDEDRIGGIPIVRTDRGGSVTYHGPGQVVGYPILRLKQYCAGPKAYVAMLEEVLIRVLHEWHVPGRHLDGLPGVWVGTDRAEKIASIGVRIYQGITTHGFALNVDMDLTPFSLIVPCGITGCRVTSMSRHLARPVNVTSVKHDLAAAFSEVFRLAWANRPGGDPPESEGRRRALGFAAASLDR